MAVLLPYALFWFSTLLFRIANPYTQWVWIANPDQRHADEHPRGRVNEHPPGRDIRWVGKEQQYDTEHPPRRITTLSQCPSPHNSHRVISVANLSQAQKYNPSDNSSLLAIPYLPFYRLATIEYLYTNSTCRD